ncbi:MAG: transcription-repair coupling factor [Acidobacteria bacterium]|nr:transcription-repair coupling factor [Acidobacteriota bacterium]
MNTKLAVITPLTNFITSTSFRRLLNDLKTSQKPLAVSGLTGSAKAFLIAALNKELARPILTIVRSNNELETLERDLKFFYQALRQGSKEESSSAKRLKPETIITLPVAEVNPYQGLSPHPEVEQKRAFALDTLARGGGELLITPARTLIERTPSPKQMLNLSIQLKSGEDCPPDLIVDMLSANGYLREDPINSIGSYSLRGGILDVFSPNYSDPLRMEFFGDTLESIRTFDPDTQRSKERLEGVRLVPMRTQSASAEGLRRFARAAKDFWKAPQYQKELSDLLLSAESGTTFESWEYLFPLLNPLESSLFDYLRNPLVIVDEPAEIDLELNKLYAKFNETYHLVDEAGSLALTPEKLFMTVEGLRSRLDHRQRLELRLLGLEAAQIDTQFETEQQNIRTLFLFPVEACAAEHRIRSQSTQRYHGRIPDLTHNLTKWQQAGESSVLVMPSLGVAERVVEILRDYSVRAELRPELTHSISSSSQEIIVTLGKLSNGCELPDTKLRLLIETDIFDEAASSDFRQSQTRRKRTQLSAFLSDFRDLKPGDYVVHVDHGIGQFQGLQQMQVSPTTKREFMLLTYAEGTKLYVPVERLDLVQKFASAENVSRPSLDKLGGLNWQKTKSRVKKAMRDMAEELLKLYAERKLVKRSPFSDDSPWQQEFEDAFEYQLTPDQDAAVEDIKTDLHSETPMDRLLCGDVGFGKTEVAMRAAFKVVSDGKQIAVLAPTTVLAYQHYKTFQQRFASFPITIELLSRFRSAKEQKETVSRLAEGKVDIVVGTHRLLSKDIQFKSLGLVIVDEEQRFGVGHKEKLKQMRRRVDVLTMSATPIPRTLNMSLAGLRDMSVIETPPSDRLAVQTHVVQFNEGVIRSAIEMELQRNGQIFFVHNRVETIYSIADLIKKLVPKARVGVGHGQLNETALEDVMMKFIQHETDILVATTIIENGIDIPLANTIIIDHADHYGLSQLYQLRGRVGRSNRRAYAYLLVPSEQTLTPIARRRLAAIREFSDLGSGFRIAALDLELRGAGNLLGGQQSGHIDSIGFDLYCQMLERTVQELRGQPIEDDTNVAINLGVDIRIPEDYISDTGQRLRTYKRISSANNEQERSSIAEELVDRYGRRPDSVENLFHYSKLRAFANNLGIVSIDREQKYLNIKWKENAKIEPNKLIEFVGTNKDASFSPSGVLKIKLISEISDEALFLTIENLLRKFAKPT